MDKCKDCYIGNEYSDYDLEDPVYESTLFCEFYGPRTDRRFNYCPYCGNKIDWEKLDAV